MSPTRYLVTGAAGFIGSHIVDALIKKGSEVVAVDNLVTGRRENLRGVPLEELDVRDTDELRRLMAGCDFVLHQAALGSVPRSIEDPLGTHSNNVDGLVSVLEAARATGVQRVVAASSSSVYGDSDEPKKNERLDLRPRSPYAATKVAGEAYCRAWFEAYGLQTVSLRYFNVYGPRQRPDGPYAAVVPRFVTAALAGAPLTVHGDGNQSRDFTFVDDAVEANLHACHTSPSRAAGHAYNIAGGLTISVNGMAQLVWDAVGVPEAERRVEWLPERPGDVRHSAAQISRARVALQYCPCVLPPEGIAATVRYFRTAGFTGRV